MALTNEQFDLIARGYEERRRRARTERERRLEEIRNKIPDYEALSRQTLALAADFAARFSSDDADAADYERKLSDIRRKKEQLLMEAGFPADYPETVYECPDCRDTGFTDGIKCHCFRKQEIELLYEQSHLNELARRLSFSSLKEELYADTPEDLQHFRGARDTALRFVDHFSESGKDILFMGSVGTGKTTLSVCIAGELIRRGIYVLYFSAVSLFEQLARFHFSRSREEESDDLTRELFNCELLVIDDLGTELTNSFVEEQLFLLLNERGIRDRRTIISTNLSMDDLRRIYGDRVFSRLLSSFMILKLTGSDIRLKLAMK